MSDKAEKKTEKKIVSKEEKKEAIKAIYDSFAELSELCYIEDLNKFVDKITKSMTMIILHNIDSMQKNKHEDNPFNHSKFILLEDKGDKDAMKGKKVIFKFTTQLKEMIGFVVNRVIFESTLIPPEGTNNMETYTLKALTINNDMESFLLRSIIPSVILYGDSFKDQEDHELSKHVKSVIAKKLKTCSSESITLFTEKYLTTYLKMISYHITQHIWSNYKGMKYLSIECIMRTLNMGTEDYLIKNKYIRFDGNPKGLSKGIFKIANALLELLHPKKIKASKKSDDEEEEEEEEKKKPKKPIKSDEEKKPKKSTDKKKSEESDEEEKKKPKKTTDKKKSEEPDEEEKKPKKSDEEEKKPKKTTDKKKSEESDEEKKPTKTTEKKKPKKSDEEDKKKNNPTKSTAKKSNKKPKSDDEDDRDDKNEEFHDVNDDELEYAN
jgi:hypothetical protein